MIREPSELRRGFVKAVEFGAQLGTFYLSSLVIGVLERTLGIADPGPWADGLALLVSILIGAILPGLIFAAPTLTIQWQVDNVDAAGQAQVDLRARQNNREFTFRVQSHARFSSLVGWMVLGSLVRRARPVMITFAPPNSATRLKRQASTGGATFAGDTITLPLTSADQNSQQSMFFGSMLTISAGAQYDFRADASLGQVNRVTSWFVKVTTDVSSLRVIG